jgi:hypothetical protein
MRGEIVGRAPGVKDCFMPSESLILSLRAGNAADCWPEKTG